MRARKIYYGDFETTTYDEETESVEVYLWVVLRKKQIFKGFNIESFIDTIRDFNKAIIYFHNLKFDFSYIQWYLQKNNIKYEMLEKNGNIYSVKFFNIELRDSLNFMPITLKQVGENYCQKYKKTSIDYNVERGHKATEEEIEYCINDCKVLEEGLNNYLTTLEDVIEESGALNSVLKVRKKMTNSGVAFEVFKEMSDYEKLCPQNTPKHYEFIKKAYRGGYVYSKPCGIQEDVMMIDCNSMYPYIYSFIDLPYGREHREDNLTELRKHKFFIVKLLINYELKEGYLPIISDSFGLTNQHYKESSNNVYEEIVVCNYDFDLITSYYVCDYKIVWGFWYETKANFFKEYADTFINFKNQYKGVKRAVSKVLLNSPYGKTAMNGFVEKKSYFLDEDDIIKSMVSEWSIDEKMFNYIEIAIAITGGARYYLLSTAEQIGFENVLYMDTDSIKFKRVPIPFELDDNKLGAWKNEGLVALFKTIAPKKYVYWGDISQGFQDNTIHYTCAGFSKKSLTKALKHNLKVKRGRAIYLMKKFDKGLKIECLQSKVVKGGRALLPILKEIK